MTSIPEARAQSARELRDGPVPRVAKTPILQSDANLVRLIATFNIASGAILKAEFQTRPTTDARWSDRLPDWCVALPAVYDGDRIPAEVNGEATRPLVERAIAYAETYRQAGADAAQAVERAHALSRLRRRSPNAFNVYHHGTLQKQAEVAATLRAIKAALATDSESAGVAG